MRPYQNYKKVEVSTADPVRIVVLLYEGAIKNLNIVARTFEKQPEEAAAKLSRTLDIINYLRSSLDMDKGGEIARNLERLYDYMRDRLSEANLNRDVEKIREVIELLQTLLEGWRAIAPNQTTEMEPGHSSLPGGAGAGGNSGLSMVVG